MFKQISPKYFIDIGNSSTVLADPNNLKELNKVLTKQLFNDISCLGISQSDQCFVSSVVPTLNRQFLKYFSNSQFISYKDIPFKSIDLDQPNEIGIDRLLSAYAAWRVHKQAVLVVDAGTAITFCLVSSQGSYLGGAIVPGLGTSSKALNDYTEKIPYINVQRPNSLIGRNTKQAVQSGLYYGFESLINGMINKYKQENSEPLKVVATGESLEIFNNSLSIDQYDEKLLFKGMALLV